MPMSLGSIFKTEQAGENKMVKYQPWSEAQAEQELSKRFQFAQQARKTQEEFWLEGERGMYSVDGGDPNFVGKSNSSSDGKGKVTYLGTNRINHHIRYKHSQLSTNPPMVLPRPNSNDPEDVRKAGIADKLAHYALRTYNMQDVIDQVTLNTLIYGIGFSKQVWNPDLGEIISFDEENGEIITEGDFEFKPLNPWSIYPDPDACAWSGSSGIKWIFEEIFMDYNQACHTWPDKVDILEQFRIKEETAENGVECRSLSWLNRPKYDVVRVLQYWERGLPYNGLVGRFGWCVTDGSSVKILTGLKPNPNAFSPDDKRPGIAQLPYGSITDQDVPGSYWGRSDISFAIKHQDARNMLDTAQLDILKAHGVARLVVFGGSEVNKEQTITNSPLDIITVDGNQKPDFINPVPMPQGMINFTQSLKQGEDEIFSINEAMMGVMNRETAGTAMQYATANGNAIRYRLFLKYTKFVEDLYKSFFNIVKKNWSTGRTVKVVGKERAYEVMDIKGTDIDGGFDIVAEYGTSFSLDPLQRRQELMTMSPLLKEAGISIKAQLKYMKMNMLDAVYDRVELGTARQQEIFTKMCETGQYIAPEEYQDHASMLEYGQNYVMTAEFTYLPKEKRDLIVRHFNERLQMSGTQAATATGAGAPPPEGAAPEAGAPPAAAPAGPPPANIMDLLGKA